MKLRNIKKMSGPNDGTRTLFESVMAPEVIRALHDWQANGGRGVVIGGVALSYYAKPRYTQDVDVLLMTDSEIPAVVNGFSHNRIHAFEHKRTGVEVEIVTPEHVAPNLSPETVKKVIETATISDGIRIASPSGIIALKLARFSAQDKADMIALIKSGQPIDISGFCLPQDQIQKFIGIMHDAEDE